MSRWNPEPAIDRILRRLVKDHTRGCWLWPGSGNGSGYGTINIGGRPRFVHRVVYESFCADIPPKLCVLHRCDNPPCCNPTHLFLGTHLENMQDMAAKGRKAIGSRVGGCKLREAEIVEMRRLRLEDGWTYERIAEKFGVAVGTAHPAINGRTWRHIPTYEESHDGRE